MQRFLIEREIVGASGLTTEHVVDNDFQGQRLECDERRGPERHQKDRQPTLRTVPGVPQQQSIAMPASRSSQPMLIVT